MQPFFCIKYTVLIGTPRRGSDRTARLIREVSFQPRWGLQNAEFDVNKVLTPNEYYDILCGCASEFQMWETVYCHSLPDHEALLDWVRATRLRPYLEAMGDEQASDFEQELLRLVRDTYPVQKDGNVLLRFRRFFFVAER